MTAEQRNPKVSRTPDGVRFEIHVSPRARRTRVGGLHGSALRVAVTAAPVEGRANRACEAALADALGLRERDVRIRSGERGRHKRVEARGDPATLEARLRALAEG